MKTLGSVLKMIRTGKGVSQARLAERVEVSEGYISLLEHGKRDPTWSMIQRICGELDVSLGLVVLLTQDEDPDCMPFVHAAYAAVWQQIKVPF